MKLHIFHFPTVAFDWETSLPFPVFPYIFNLFLFIKKFGCNEKLPWFTTRFFCYKCWDERRKMVKSGRSGRNVEDTFFFFILSFIYSIFPYYYSASYRHLIKSDERNFPRDWKKIFPFLLFPFIYSSFLWRNPPIESQVNQVFNSELLITSFFLWFFKTPLPFDILSDTFKSLEMRLTRPNGFWESSEMKANYNGLRNTCCRWLGSLCRKK